MKREFLIVYLLIICSFVFGCSSNTNTNRITKNETYTTNENSISTNEENSIKKYVLVENDKNNYILAPTITLDTKDRSFTFFYDALSSYASIGYYTESDNTIIAITIDNQYKYIFNIIDENTLSFNTKESSELHFIEENTINDNKFKKDN